MSSIDRQNRLLLAEDWTKIYQSFNNAEFKSYDFDTLRRTMISYLRKNYPEDFNDYIESSEYLAIIDMIAFLGQNLSYRTDLNARENYLELAERRESVLRLARLLSYNVTRNQAANGFLKITAVQTSENVIDSNGNSLSGRSILWNDNVNNDWFEHFVKILNAANNVSNQFGRPVNNQVIDGIPTEQYTFETNNGGIPIYAFNRDVNGEGLDFEVVSTIIDNGELKEATPKPAEPLSYIYRDNGRGPGASSTGFFMHFRQGRLQRGDFSVDFPVPNQKIDIDTTNINNSDVWLFGLDSASRETTEWTKIDAVEGNNIVYNSISKNIKNVFSVLSRADDRISLIFSDGVFGNLPTGTFRVYYRTSANSDVVILPNNIKDVQVTIPYISSTGRTETLVLTLSLQETISNSASSESTDSIRNNASSTYYTQNRMVTGEDYNVGPLGVSQDIIKVKSLNRIASGISRNYDILDATGKYSSTNLFATDGILYKEYVDEVTSFDFTTRSDILQTILNKITPLLQSKNIRNFYLENYNRQDYRELGLVWHEETIDTNRTTGMFEDSNLIRYTVGSFTEGPLRFIEPGAMVKFTAPSGYHFMTNDDNKLMLGDATHRYSTSYIWTKCISVTNGGNTVDETTGLGGVVFNDAIPDGAVLDSAIPKLSTQLIVDIQGQMVDQIFSYNTFGLRYDRESRSWKVITQDNLNITGDFSLGQAGDISNSRIDSSWLFLFETDGETYTVTYRTLRYIFESDTELRFYFDNNKKIFDSKSGKIIRDRVSVLNINNDVNSSTGTESYTLDYDWEISSVYRDQDGYIDSTRVEVAFFDSDDDGVIDNPDLFTEIVDSTNYIFLKAKQQNNTTVYNYVSAESENINVVGFSTDINLLTPNNPKYYVSATDEFYILDSVNRTLSPSYDYKAFIGRDSISFRYVHASDENSRIDPSSTNVIDVYLMTRAYDTAFRQYLRNIVTTKPLPLSSDQMARYYGGEIEKVKSISDEIIYHPVKYKVLFGDKADIDLQAAIKVVKSKERVINDNELKVRIVQATNEFFALDNWDFGETFYWSELSAYIMKQLAPDVNSIVVVPRLASSSYGSLQEIKCDSDEILISGATVSDIEIIDALTSERLKASGTVVTQSEFVGSGIQSAEETTTDNFIIGSTDNTGGY